MNRIGKIMMRHMIVVIVVVGLLGIAHTDIVNAYSSGAGKTHHMILDQAKVILANDGKAAYANFLDSTYPGSSESYLAIMKKGNDENDDILQAEPREHFMDPCDHEGWSDLKSAGTLCQEKFNSAVIYWNNGDKYNAMYYLGWAAHCLQDICVPQHAFPTIVRGHSDYETWVTDYQNNYKVTSGGVYSFSAFGGQYYSRHYGDARTAWDWVDYNAHEAIKYYACSDVNYGVGWHYDDEYEVETTHNLPHNYDHTYVITMKTATSIKLKFATINTEKNYDFIYIYDGNNNLIHQISGSYTNWWTNTINGDTMKIRMTTDGSVASWGYKTARLEWNDPYGGTEKCDLATSTLLRRAQRTVAGFINFFFSKVNNPPSLGDSYEPDNSFTQYSTMTVTTSLQSQSRSIDPAGDNDYIRFYAYSGNKYIFYTESSIDTYGHLYDSSQSQLDYDDDDGTDYNFRIEYTITSSGYYFLRVRGYSSSTQGPYALYYKYEISPGGHGYAVTTVSYSWRDAVSGGTMVANGDDAYTQVSLPFNFNFYGASYSSVYICSNGILTFGSATTEYSNVAIPNTAAPNNFVAPFWDDLNPSSSGSGKIYYKSFSTYVVVTWENVYLYGKTTPQKFQVILYNTGEIRFQYHTLNSGYSCTVGVENSGGTSGTAYTSPLYNGLALKFVYS